VKLQREKGDVSLDAPHDHHYPNHDWKEHECPTMPAHQLRVIEEKRELAEKYRKLVEFTARARHFEGCRSRNRIG
jgi:hypothetical protein